jgi:hypothetical protein
MIPSEWKSVLLDYDRATEEFVGDDVDRFSALLDLGECYEFITVLIPALSAEGTVTPYIQKDEKIATIPVAVHAMDDDTTGSFAHATSSGAGSIAVIFRIGGAQYIRLYVGADQTANRTFYVRGFNRGATD